MQSMNFSDLLTSWGVWWKYLHHLSIPLEAAVGVAAIIVAEEVEVGVGNAGVEVAMEVEAAVGVEENLEISRHQRAVKRCTQVLSWTRISLRTSGTLGLILPSMKIFQ